MMKTIRQKAAIISTMLCAALACLFLSAAIGPSHAQMHQGIAVDLAEDHVDITTGFAGGRMTLFGVRNEPGDIAIVVRGPEADLVVRRKAQVLGIWMNRMSIAFQNSPVYYDYALSRAEREIAPGEVLERHEIGLTNMEFRYTGREDADTVLRFREALIRDRQQQGHYPLEPKPVIFRDANFFRADFFVPPDVPTGIYTIYSYLFRDGQLISENRTNLRIAQVGFNARLFDFAHDNSLLYGLVAVLFAIVAGVSAYSLLRRE